VRWRGAWGGALPLAALVLAAVLSGCCAAPEPTRLPPGERGLASWRAARERYRGLKDRLGATEPFVMKVGLEIEQPLLGKRMRGRGALAVAQPDALRMVLLGPGGTTALDLWLCRDRFRFVVPALDLVRRGDRSTPRRELRGLPVDFLRWWLLDPLGGELLAVRRRRHDGELLERYVLRDGADVLHADAPVASLVGSTPPPPGSMLRVRRLSDGGEQRIAAEGGRCGVVHYQQPSTGLNITVRCESIEPGPPPQRAFADPDDPRVSCLAAEPEEGGG
jgi:hypothetical protein